MRIHRLVFVAVLALAAASCGQDDSGNVMAPQANPLDPAQVDLALGPEIGNADGTGADGTNEVNAVDPAETPRPQSKAPVSEPAAATPETADTPEAPEDADSVEE